MRLARSFLLLTTCRRQTRYYFPVSTSTFSILPNQPPLEHESFSAHRELEALLKKNLRGEVRFDLGSRALCTRPTPPITGSCPSA